MAALGGFVCVHGDEIEAVVIKNTFIGSQPLCQPMRRCKSESAICNPEEERHFPLLLPQLILPAGHADSLQNGKVSSSVSPGINKGKHGSLQINPWVQCNQEQEVSMSEYETTMELPGDMEYEWSLRSAQIAESLDNGKVISFIFPGINQGEHGRLQMNPWAQSNQGEEMSIIECEKMTELPGETIAESEWSLGSAQHHEGLCKPCAWYRKRRCTMGAACGYCHLCGDGELKARKKKKGKLIKELIKQKREASHPLTPSSSWVDNERITMLQGPLLQALQCLPPVEEAAGRMQRDTGLHEMLQQRPTFACAQQQVDIGQQGNGPINCRTNGIGVNNR